MRIDARKVSLATVESQTGFQSGRVGEYVKIASQLANDPDKAKRKEELLCPPCFYLRRQYLAGKAFTDTECGWCGTSMRFSNTNVDRLCKSCAKSLGVCKHCGADVNLKKRRKLEPKR